jgi:signal transduction histidine kinase
VNVAAPAALQSPDMLGELLHTLSQPLTGLRCSLELAIDEDAAQSHQTVMAALEQTERVIRVVRLMQEFLDFDSSEPTSSPILFAPVAHQVFEQLAPLAQAQQVRVHIKGTCNAGIRISQPRLALALQYLIGGVIEAQPSSSAIRFMLQDRPAASLMTVYALPGVRRQQNGSPREDPVMLTIRRVRMAIARRVFESAGATLQLDERARPGFNLIIPRT